VYMGVAYIIMTKAVAVRKAPPYVFGVGVKYLINFNFNPVCIVSHSVIPLPTQVQVHQLAVPVHKGSFLFRYGQRRPS